MPPGAAFNHFVATALGEPQARSTSSFAALSRRQPYLSGEAFGLRTESTAASSRSLTPEPERRTSVICNANMVVQSISSALARASASMRSTPGPARRSSSPSPPARRRSHSAGTPPRADRRLENAKDSERHRRWQDVIIGDDIRGSIDFGRSGQAGHGQDQQADDAHIRATEVPTSTHTVNPRTGSRLDGLNPLHSRRSIAASDHAGRQRRSWLPSDKQCSRKKTRQHRIQAAVLCSRSNFRFPDGAAQPWRNRW